MTALKKEVAPTSSKNMPIKDLAEARKIIETLFELAVDNGFHYRERAEKAKTAEAAVHELE